MKIRKLFFISLIILGLFGVSCENGVLNPKDLPTETSQGILAVIEIPSGTNRKVEYNPQTEKFEIDVIDGTERVVNFLSYPGNYGFIPSTLMNEENGGDGDALDILVLSESMQTGDTISVIPIGTLLLKDSGELDTKIIAVPVNPSKQIIKATDYQNFTVKYNAVQKIIENWFLNYKGLGVVEFLGWKNDKYTLQEIKKWQVKKDH